MFNYHKMGFLDVRKLYRYVGGKTYWLNTLDPVWLFVNSDIYKPYIAYTEEYCIIRVNIPNVGPTYYPLLGNGDYRWHFMELTNEALYNGYDFNITSCDEELKRMVEKDDIKFLECSRYNNYIYMTDSLIWYKDKKLKTKRLLKDNFIKNNPNVYFREIKKEDFPNILEFFNEYKEERNLDPLVYVPILNKLKKLMDQLYEFDLISTIVMSEDKIYGIMIGSVLDNICHVHMCAALKIVGCKENLISCFARKVYGKTKYINFGFTDNDLTVEKSNEEFIPYKIEKFYSTFNV